MREMDEGTLFACFRMSKNCFHDLLHRIFSHLTCQSLLRAIHCEPTVLFPSAKASRALFPSRRQLLSAQSSQPIKTWNKSKRLQLSKFWQEQDTVGRHIFMSFLRHFCLKTLSTDTCLLYLSSIKQLSLPDCENNKLQFCFSSHLQRFGCSTLSLRSDRRTCREPEKSW